MDYGMIGKIEKAKYYAEERAERIQFETFQARVVGDNSARHVVSYVANSENGHWRCDCDFFSTRGVCSHTMAMERVLQNMVEIG